MKKSEQLLGEAAMEPNDLKAMGKYRKFIRETRIERFDDLYLKRLAEKYDQFKFNEALGKYSLYDEKYGHIDFYPKANNLFIRSKQKWIKPGLRWIVKNLLSP